MKDILIYAKTIKEYFSKKPGRKPKDPLTIHVMGKLSSIMLGKPTLVKYRDPRNSILIVQINGVDIPNVLVYLGATINVVTSATMITLVCETLNQLPPS